MELFEDEDLEEMPEQTLEESLPKKFVSSKEKSQLSAPQSESSFGKAGKSSLLRDDYDVNEDPRMRLYEMLRSRPKKDAVLEQRMFDQMNAARESKALNQLAALGAQTSSKMGTLGGKRSEVANFQPLIESIYERDIGPVADAKTMRAQAGIEPIQIRELELGLKMENALRRRQMDEAKLQELDESSQTDREKLKLLLRAQQERERAARAKEGLEGRKIEKVTEKPPTESQATAKLQAGVALDALPNVEKMELEGYRPGARTAIASNLPTDLSNYLLSDLDQQYQANINVVVEQILRSATGAAAGEGEIRRTLKSYSVQPGDSETTIKLKQSLRRNYINNLMGKAGPSTKGMGMPEMPQKMLPPKSTQPTKTLTKQQYSKSKNLTRKYYSDGSMVELEGDQTE